MAFGGRGRERGRGGIQVRIHFAPQYAAAARAVPGEAPWKKGEKDSHGAQLHAGLKFSLSAAAVAAAPPSYPPSSTSRPGRGRRPRPSHQHKFVEREEIGRKGLRRRRRMA